MTAWVSEVDWVVGITTDPNENTLLGIASSGDCTRLVCNTGLGQRVYCRCRRRRRCGRACDRTLWLPYSVFAA